MHHIYTTPAFVVSSLPKGEAGKSLLLFTRDFGMIWATAQGIRLEQSKLRHHIQDYSFSYVSIVRGKEMWRLTGAGELEEKIKPSKLYVRILNVLKRLLTGEEKNEKLFEIIETSAQASFDEKDTEFVECIIMLRILNALGYISNKKEFEQFLADNSLAPGLIEEMKKVKLLVVQEINSALKESQL